MERNGVAFNCSFDDDAELNELQRWNLDFQLKNIRRRKEAAVDQVVNGVAASTN